VGSNPILSAIKKKPRKGLFFYGREEVQEAKQASKKLPGAIFICYIHVAYPSNHHKKRDFQN
jgi:hypothetical protein